MNRKTLSRNLLINKVITTILAVLVLVGWIFYSLPPGMLLFGAIFVVIIGLIAFFPRKIIEFDQDFLYIRYLGSETKIELTKVSLVSITSFSLNHQNRWKIEYWDNGITEVGFFPGSFSNLDDFADLVQQKNPDTKIVRSISSFD
ncbi:MAG TPA: hypothetical protein VFE54_01935 [Mucilaginibacter sp.]|nr:hypothetical protein [Mucilaginibacter sp.]